MNSKSGLLTLLVLFTFLQSCQAQSKNIRSAKAFAKEMAYGKEMKDLEGNTIDRRDTVYFIFLEVNGKSRPEVSTVLYNGKIFTASVHPVKEKEVVAGINKATDKKIVITKKASNSLWRAELSPTDTPKKSDSTSKKMTIKGRVNNRPFILTIKKPILLAADIVG
jgi:hypothetical protein